MAKKDNEVQENKSHSQVKREERRKEVAKARRISKTGTIIGWVIGIVIIALIVWGVATLVINQMNKVSPTSDYSEGLDENGYIKGVTASDKVELPEYKGIEVPYEEIEYTDEQIDTDIQNEIENYKELSTDESLKIQDGDTVNIGYVGTVDGEEFDGGSSDSYDLEIGSDTFIDGFEDALIGHDNMTTFDINVTFPEDYSSTDLAGQDAVFTVTVNGIYQYPEFTDEFVAENLSDEGCSTVEEYRENDRAENEESSLKDWVEDYLKENTTVKSYPRKYLKIRKSVQRYDDEQMYTMMNEMYEQYYGYSPYSDFYSYMQVETEAEYLEELETSAKEQVKEDLLYQAIVEQEGAVADAAWYKQYLVEDGQDESSYDSSVETTGEPFVLQSAIKEKALEIVMDAAVIQK